MSIYALSDIHGFYSIYEKVAAALREEDRAYFLGDAGDRGPQGWECIKAIYNDPRFIYLKGNHEDMTAKAILGDPEAEHLSYYNGGFDTLQTWRLDGMNQEWGRRLSALPHKMMITNAQGQKIWLSHAGFTPTYDPNEHDCIWGRDHIFHPWKGIEGSIYVVHGHTPVRSIKSVPKEDWYKPYIYAGGHKIDIDMGTYRSEKACLLNLDSWEYEIING